MSMWLGLKTLKLPGLVCLGTVHFQWVKFSGFLLETTQNLCPLRKHLAVNIPSALSYIWVTVFCCYQWHFLSVWPMLKTYISISPFDDKFGTFLKTLKTRHWRRAANLSKSLLLLVVFVRYFEDYYPVNKSAYDSSCKSFTDILQWMQTH